MPTIATVKNPPVRTLMAVSSSNKGEAGKKIPRRNPVYPISAERELARGFLMVPAVIIQKSKPYIDRIIAIYDVWAQENVRVDARISMQDAIGMILEEYGADIMDGIDIGKITDKVNRTARYARNISVRDWKALVKNAVNLTIDEPFYMESMDDLIGKWAYQSVQSITGYPQEYLDKIQEIITWGYTTRQPMVNVYRRIQKLTGGTKSHAKMMARDLMGTLNCQMTRYEHESMGVSQYKWITKRDARVRECHRELHGHIFDWNNPPAQWYYTKGRGIIYDGQYCHPGEAYGCRCVAQPVFDEKKLQAYMSEDRVRPTA